MPKTRQQKEESVLKLQEKVKLAKALVFADYKGLTMKQLSGLRHQLREAKGEFAITKNALLQRALPPTTYNLQPTTLTGPTATLFAYDDEVTPIKMLVKTLKDASLGKIKSGFLGHDYLDESKIQYLASLPGRDELRGRTVGVLAALLQGIVSVLSGNLRNLVYALSGIQKMKGGD